MAGMELCLTQGSETLQSWSSSGRLPEAVEGECTLALRSMLGTFLWQPL